MSTSKLKKKHAGQIQDWFTQFLEKSVAGHTTRPPYTACASEQHDDLWCFNRAGRTRQREHEMSLGLGQLSEGRWSEWMENWVEKWLPSFMGSPSLSGQTSLKDTDEYTERDEGGAEGAETEQDDSDGTAETLRIHIVITFQLKTDNICTSKIIHYRVYSQNC